MPILAILAVAALAPVVGDLIGRALSSGDMDEAKRLADEAVKKYNISPPSIAAMTAHLEKSQLSQAQADPESIAAQRGALAQLQRRGLQGPNNIEFRAGMDEATQAANQQAASQNALLRNEMQARGRGNSGAEYALRGLANQQAAERASRGGFQAAAEGNRQALQALQAYGGLAGQMRGQSFNEDATRRRADDETARFNEEHRVDAINRDWANRFGLAGAQSDAAFKGANIYQGRAADTRNQWSGYGQGVGAAAGSFGGYQMDQDYLDKQRNLYAPQSGSYGYSGSGPQATWGGG